MRLLSDLTFLGVPATDPADLSVPFAYLGVPFGPPYEADDLTVAAGAADAVRLLTHRMEYPRLWTHHDFDWDGPLFPDGVPTVADCGDVQGDVRAPDSIGAVVTDAVASIVQRRAVPLVVGGLDATPPMVVRALADREVVHVLHIDAHLDFRDEVDGVADGYSSPIRRIREQVNVGRIVQVGLRSVGSARPADVADARRAGNRLVTAWEIHERGLPAITDHLDVPGPWVVTIDCDGLDPSIAPGVGWPEPGGLTYPQAASVLRWLARRGLVAAMVVTEFQPARDVHDMTALTISRLLLQVIGFQRDAVAGTDDLGHPERRDER